MAWLESTFAVHPPEDTAFADGQSHFALNPKRQGRAGQERRFSWNCILLINEAATLEDLESRTYRGLKSRGEAL